MSGALPRLRLPAAVLRLWVEGPPGLASRLAGLDVGSAGAVPVAPGSWALPPSAGDPAVFDRAVRLGQRLLGALAAEIGHGRVRALIVPGALEAVGGQLTLLEDALLAELGRKPPALVADALHLTGHAARGLEGRWATAAGANLQIGSGRVVPTVVLGPPAPGLPPWRNPEVLARTLRWVPRPEPTAQLEAQLQAPVVRLTGPIGVGKTRLAFEVLRGGARAALWRRAGGEPGEPPPPLERALAAERQRPLWLVYDTLESADDGVWREIEEVTARPDFGEALHLLLIARAGSDFRGVTAEAPQVALGALAGEEWERFCFQVYHGLALPIGVSERLAARAAGNPFALEEALLYLVRDRQLRQVFGSFFFSGAEDRAEFQPSSRFRLHSEAEAARLGEVSPLRYLALASAAVPTAELGAATFAAGGGAPAPGWETRALDAGLLVRREGPWGDGLEHAWPAVALALAGALEPETAAAARRTLGELLAARSATAEESWGAWPLLAGSQDGAQAVLAAATAPSAQIPRESLYTALRDELASACERAGDPALELDLLWALLPHARRLGRLHELESAITRGLDLAGRRPEKFLAIAAVAAELLQKAGRFREAEATLRQALAAARATDERKKELLLVELGRVLVRQGRRAEAQEILAKTLAVAERSRRRSVTAACHFHLGNIALHEFRLDQASQHHEAALALRRSGGPAVATAASLSALGAVALAQGNFPSGLALYQEAQRALEGGDGNEAEEAYALLGAGRALARLGDFAGAAPVLKRALALREGRDDAVGEAIARVALAEVHLELGQLEVAHQEARKALFALSIVPEVDARADAERVLGQVLLRQRRPEEADARLAEAERIYRAAGNDFALLTVLAHRLDAAIVAGEVDAVAAAFDSLATERRRLPQIVSAALFDYPLSQGARWLRERRGDGPDPAPFLEQAYHELLRQTTFLTPEMRQRFLFQIPANAAILEAATQRGLSMPKA